MYSFGKKVSIKPCYKGKQYSSAGNVACVGVHGHDFYPLNLDSAIVTSSVDFQLFLSNIRSQEVAKEKSNELKRGSRCLMASLEMEGEALLPPCRCFPFELGNKSSLFGSHQPNRLNVTEHFLLPVFMLNSYPQCFTDSTVCLEISLRVRDILRCLGHSLCVRGEERLLLLAYSCILL